MNRRKKVPDTFNSPRKTHGDSQMRMTGGSRLQSIFILTLGRDRLVEFLDAHRRPVIAVLLLLGLLWRVVFFLETSGGTTVAYLTVDERYHHETAGAIARGQWLQDGANSVFFRAPFYYYFLAGVYRIAPDNLTVARCLQILLSTVSCLLVYLIARKLFNPRAALPALLLSCFYGPFFYFATQLLFETVLVFLCLAGLLSLLVAYERRSIGWWLASGLVFGLSAITRPNMLLFLAPLSIWIYWSQRKQAPLRRIALYEIVFYLGCAIPILPVTLHNYYVGHDFELIASQGGVNFYIGNNAKADGVSAVVPEIEEHGGDFQNLAAFEDYNVFARAALHNPQAKPSEIDRYWYHKGLAWIRAHPGDFLRLFLRKCYYYWNGHEIGNDRAMGQVTGKSVVYRYLSFSFWLVCPLAFAGVYLAWRNHLRIGVLLLFVVTFSGSIVIFFVNARYRLPIAPVVIMFAAYTLHVWLEGPRARQLSPRNKPGDLRPAGRWISVLIAALGLAFVWPNAVLRAAEFSPGYYMEGRRYQSAGDYSQAVAAYERCKSYADAHGDRYVLLSRTALAQIYAEVYKDLPKARQNFLEALSLAPDDMAILNDVGVMYNFFGQYREAKPYLLKALKVRPGNPDVLKNLAKSYEMTQDYDKAIATYQQIAAQAGPNAYVAYTQMGNIYWLKGDAANARANVTRALALKPDYAPAQKLLARLPP